MQGPVFRGSAKRRGDNRPTDTDRKTCGVNKGGNMALGDQNIKEIDGVVITQTEGEATVLNGKGEVKGKHKVISETRKYPDGHQDCTVFVPGIG